MPSLHFPPDKRPLSRVKIMLLMLWHCESTKQTDRNQEQEQEQDVQDQEKINPKNCHLHDIRITCGFPLNKNFKEWYEWVRSLSEKDAEYYYKKHEECIRCPTRLYNIKT